MTDDNAASPDAGLVERLSTECPVTNDTALEAADALASLSREHEALKVYNANFYHEQRRRMAAEAQVEALKEELALANENTAYWRAQVEALKAELAAGWNAETVTRQVADFNKLVDELYKLRAQVEALKVNLRTHRHWMNEYLGHDDCDICEAAMARKQKRGE